MAPPSLKRTELPSGIRVLSEPMPDARSISFGLWIDAGSRDEAPSQQGLSHFLEHMLFKGTPSRDARGIAEGFDHIGADINASTGREHTSIYSRVLSEHLPRAVEIVLDMVRNSILDPGELDLERKVVLEEINMHNDSPDELVHDYLFEILWGDHPIGHSVLGDEPVIRTVDRDYLLEFCCERYVGSRIVVAASGAVDHDSLCGLIDGATPYLTAGMPAVRSSLASPNTGTRIFGKDTEQAHIVLGGRGLPRRHSDRFALSVMDNILGGSMSSRLFQRVREQLGLVYSIYSYSALFIGMGMVGIYAGTHPSQAAQVIELVEEELIRIRDSGFTPDELARAKNHLRGLIYIGNEDSANRMNRIAKADLSGGEHLSADELAARVDAVETGDIDRLFGETWGAVTPSLAVIGPFEDGELSLSGRL